MENELNKKKPLNEGDLEKVTGGDIPVVLGYIEYECPKCREKILADIYNKHVKTCKGKSE